MDLHNYYNLDLGSLTNIDLRHDIFHRNNRTSSSVWLVLEEEFIYYSLDFGFGLNLFGFVEEDYRSFFYHGFVHSYVIDVYDQVADIEYTKIPSNAYPTQFNEEDQDADS